MTDTLMGYRAEAKPGDYLFYTVEDWGRETYGAGMVVHELHCIKQPGQPQDVVVLKGRYWVQPKYDHNACHLDPTFSPCYLGARIQ